MTTIPTPTVPVEVAIAHGQPSPEMDEARLWREGSVVVVTKDAHWPDRCIRCNAPTQGSTKRYRLSWHSPWLYLLLLGCLPVYLLVALSVQKTADIEVGVCSQHYRRTVIGTIVGWTGVFVSVSLSIASCATHPPLMAALGFFGVIVSLLVGFFMSRLMEVKKIDDHRVSLKCGESFTQSLPVLDR